MTIDRPCNCDMAKECPYLCTLHTRVVLQALRDIEILADHEGEQPGFSLKAQRIVQRVFAQIKKTSVRNA